MPCIICNKPTKKPINKFCSVECKSIAQSGKKKADLDPSKQIKCKIDGKTFKDYLNQSGTLTSYSKNTLNKPFDWNDWEIIGVSVKPRWNCPYCDWTTVDTENKSGWITTHLETTHDKTPQQHCETFPIDKHLWKTYWEEQERDQYLNESEDNRIECKICGEWMKKISNSHLQTHNITEFEYKSQFGQDSLSPLAFRKIMAGHYYQNDKMISKLSRSKYEDQLCDFFKSLDVEYIPNHKKFGFDVDIYLPDNSLAIEFNGLYWHSQWAGGKLEHYHLNKTKECEKLGIHLIHIFEDEWVNQRHIVESRLKNLLQKSSKVIYARKCELREVDYQTAAKFLSENHIQGTVTTSKVHLALFYEDEMVSLMTFGYPRNSTGNNEKIEGHWELLRFCNICNSNVVGGASKLFSYFEKTYQPVKVHTFADRRWTSTLKDSLYDELNFVRTSLGSPNYWYLIEPMKRTSRFTYTKRNILEKFKSADPNLSEWDNMVKLGFDRIWDCGSMKYEKVYDATRLVVDLSNPKPSSESQQIKKRVRAKKEITRNISDVECAICKNSYSMVGISSHFRLSHGLTVEQYVETYGEYRPLQLKQLEMLEKSAGKFVCRICNEECRNEKHLTDHLERQHDLQKDIYVMEYILSGTVPLCKCGCGELVNVMTTYPYTREYLSGHNSFGSSNVMSGKTHSDATKQKMLDKASGRFGLAWFIAEYGEMEGIAKYEERNAVLSKKRSGSGNPEFVDIPKIDMDNYIVTNPNCKLKDLVSHFGVGSTCIYGKFKLHYDCGNLKEVKQILLTKS